MWKLIEGYKWPYRINEDGEVQKNDGSGWVSLKPYLSGRRRPCVKMRTVNDGQADVPVTNLMADMFMGGRKPGECVIHKNGAKMDCSLSNLKKVTRQDCGRLSGTCRRKAVAKIAPDGEIVAIYCSVHEASRCNFISMTAVWNRCTNKVSDPFRLDGYNYQYMKE